MKQLPNYSPSLYHLWRSEHTRPALAFTGSDPRGWQRALRAKLRELAGFNPPAKRVPLHVRTLWRRSNALGTIEKIVFRSEPMVDVPAYVCLPAGARPPYRFFICLQGHSTGMHNSIAVAFDDETRSIKIPGDRDLAIGCMKRGIAALCIEQRAFGERREHLQEQMSPHPCHDAVMHSLMLGSTVIAERVFDVDRGIDYLAQRGDAAMDKIGVMGNSGGGTITTYSAALLPRISYAIPSCVFCTYRDSLMRIYHCADNHIPRILCWAEMADVLGLFAPKPVVVVAGRSDPIFPLAGAKKAFAALKRIYRAFGAEDKCRFVIGRGGHRFYAAPAWQEMTELME